MNLGMTLIFCMWLGIHKNICLIQSVHIGADMPKVNPGIIKSAV